MEDSNLVYTTMPSVTGTINPKEFTVAHTTNSIDASSCFGGSIQLDPRLTISDGGYHQYGFVQPASSKAEDSFNLNSKHKTYKVLNTILNACQEKTRYTLGISRRMNFYSSVNTSIRFKVQETFCITLFDNQKSAFTALEDLDDTSNTLFESCVEKFLNEHAHEFLKLLESEAKKDVKVTAEMESKLLKERLEFTEVLEKMED